MMRPRTAAPLLVCALTLSACGSDGETAPTDGTSRPSESTTPSSSSSTSPTSVAAPEASACVTTTRDRMTERQQAGQLLMVALTPDMGQVGLDTQIDRGLGNMLYLGGWTGSTTVAAASQHLQDQALDVDGTKVGMLVAADQEGGEVQQLTGQGFSTIPSGREQGAMDADELEQQATAWGTELKRAGVNVNLAPTTDTVPSEIGRANGPIGQHRREYGATPAATAKGAVAFAQGMHAAGVMPTTKHFPGIGRIQGNTDSTAEGITDSTATTKDPHLSPFDAVISASPTIVMIGNARYPKLDADNQAPFSQKIITNLLREQMGFDGVVITDDVGVAKAVADVPVGERATRFVAAGGDIVLTADATQTETMTQALVDAMAVDEEFAEQVEASVSRVLALKEDMGLLRCGG